MPDLSIALNITLIGMSLVFAAILLLWGMIALLMRLTAEASEPAAPEQPSDDVVSIEAAPASAGDDRDRAVAVAAAVAVRQALRERDRSRAHKPVSALNGAVHSRPADNAVSPWQAARRAGQFRSLSKGRTPR